MSWGKVADTAAGISEEQLAAVSRLLGRGNRVFVTGAARSGLVLRMAAMRLMHLGLNVQVAGDTTTAAIRESDLLLVAAGSTSGVVKAAETAAKAQARIAAFTANQGSPPADLADAVVVVPAQQKTDRGSGVSCLRKPVRAGAVRGDGIRLPVPVGHPRCPAEQLWLRHANLE